SWIDFTTRCIRDSAALPRSSRSHALPSSVGSSNSTMAFTAARSFLSACACCARLGTGWDCPRSVLACEPVLARPGRVGAGGDADAGSSQTGSRFTFDVETLLMFLHQCHGVGSGAADVFAK